MTPRPPKPPIVLDSVVDDAEEIRSMARRNGPYWQPGRMLVSAAASKQAAHSDDADSASSDDQQRLVGPVFRGDWAFGEPLVAGAEKLLYHEAFIAAAAQMYTTDVVVPEQVYVNLTSPIGRQGFSHTDIPEFRGVDRTNAPAWLLTAMGTSRRFEAERVNIVTAVAWFYRGEAGGLRYWPEGMAGPSVLQDELWNTAVVGDNDFMPHEVQRVGPRGSVPPPGMTIDSGLEFDGERWHITDDGQVLASYDDDQIRLSVSWKAKVYADDEQRQRAESGTDGLTIDDAIGRLGEDLAASSTPEALAGDALHSVALRQQLSRRYSAYAVSAPPA